MYKDINRALILQNQELRQELHKLKEEIVALNRNLMVEKHAVRMLNQRHLKLLRNVSKACNAAMQELNQPTDELPNESNQSRLANSQDKNVSRRSVRQVRPTLRQMQVDEYNKENVSPTQDDVTEESAVSYVQTRRRWDDEAPAEVESESIQTARQDISTSELDLDGSTEEGEKSAEESQDLGYRRMHTIREENTAELSLTCISSKSLSYSTLKNKSARQNSSIVSQRASSLRKTLTTQNTLKSQEDEASSIDEVSQCVPSRAIVPEQIAIDEDTILANFRSMKAPCSTPYKAHPSMLLRKCVVKIRRLAESDLVKATDISEEYEHLSVRQNVTMKRRRRENISCKMSSSRVSASRVSSHLSIDTSSSFSKKKNTTRPKRTAAPNNLKEPKLSVKLRRNV